MKVFKIIVNRYSLSNQPFINVITVIENVGDIEIELKITIFCFFKHCLMCLGIRLLKLLIKIYYRKTYTDALLLNLA